jgi:hypothetical protein
VIINRKAAPYLKASPFSITTQLAQVKTPLLKNLPDSPRQSLRCDINVTVYSFGCGLWRSLGGYLPGATLINRKLSGPLHLDLGCARMVFSSRMRQADIRRMRCHRCSAQERSYPHHSEKRIRRLSLRGRDDHPRPRQGASRNLPRFHGSLS